MDNRIVLFITSNTDSHFIILTAKALKLRHFFNKYSVGDLETIRLLLNSAVVINAVFEL